jgi:NADP-dependent 3-hydroxy acid dehydrogenase YdfG
MGFSTCSHVISIIFQIKMPKIQNVQQKFQQQQKFGDKKICVITGTSSGLGKHTAKALLETGQWHVVGAVRDMEKMEQVCNTVDIHI